MASSAWSPMSGTVGRIPWIHRDPPWSRPLRVLLSTMPEVGVREPRYRHPESASMSRNRIHLRLAGGGSGVWERCS